MPQYKNQTNPLVLVTVSGPDKAGITAQLTAALAESNAVIYDIGQAVINNWLSLSILFRTNDNEGDEKATLKDLLFKSAELGLKLEFQVFGEKIKESQISPNKKSRYAVTLLSSQIPARAIQKVSEVIVKHKLNIDEIQKLSESEFSCLEFSISSPEEINSSKLQFDLLSVAHEAGVDIALQSEGIFRRSKRLVVFDMDSTLIQNEVIDEIAELKGVKKQVSAITEKAMQGKLDFETSLRSRVELLDGLTREEIANVFDRLTLTPGAKELIQVLKKLGYKIALISGGFQCLAEKFKKELEIDYAYANQLEYNDNKTTGKIIAPIIDGQRKADLLEVIAQQEKIDLNQVIAIGDGANDVFMLQKAGLGIAFNAKQVVQDKADLAINQKNLKTIFYILGLSDRDLSEIF